MTVYMKEASVRAETGGRKWKHKGQRWSTGQYCSRTRSIRRLFLWILNILKRWRTGWTWDHWSEVWQKDSILSLHIQTAAHGPHVAQMQPQNGPSRYNHNCQVMINVHSWTDHECNTLSHASHNASPASRSAIEFKAEYPSLKERSFLNDFKSYDHNKMDTGCKRMKMYV